MHLCYERDVGCLRAPHPVKDQACRDPSHIPQGKRNTQDRDTGFANRDRGVT